ncbi:MAG: acyltransferase family protein [Burkholderiaceae bacterium]
MTSAATTRSTWIDAAKGLGILLIYLGHIWSTVTPSVVYLWIYAFHVPLFFFASGLTLRPAAGPLGGVVSKKLRTLVVPYLWYAFLGYAFYVTGYYFAQMQGIHIEQFEYGLWPPLAGIFIGTIGEGRIINGPVWFLLALFWTFLIGYLIVTHIRRPALQWAAVVALTALGLYMADHGVTLPFSGVAALGALIFMQAGYRFQQSGGVSAWSTSMRWLAVAVLFGISLFSPINGFIGFGEGVIGQPMWFLLFAFAGTLMVVLLLQLVESRIGWLAWVGRYSLEIMLIHMLIIKSVKVLLSGVLKVGMTQIDNDFGLGLIVLLASTVLMAIAIWVMVRFLPFTLGRASPKPRTTSVTP